MTTSSACMLWRGWLMTSRRSLGPFLPSSDYLSRLWRSWTSETLILSFDTFDLTAVPHRKSNYCMDRIMMHADEDGTNLAEKKRPNICHMCMKKGELGKQLMYCDQCKIAVYCSKASRVLCQRECWHVEHMDSLNVLTSWIYRYIYGLVLSPCLETYPPLALFFSVSVSPIASTPYTPAGMSEKALARTQDRMRSAEEITQAYIRSSLCSNAKIRICKPSCS